MRDEDVAQYLQNNPQFFEAHADMLANITIPHPYGGRTISLPERQMLTLREKNKGLEKRLHELMEFAKESASLQHKVHQFTLALFGNRDLISLQDAVTRNLREIFDVPHVVLHAWKESPPNPEVLAFTEQHTQPVCTLHAVHDTLRWFEEVAPHLRSFAYLPLRADGQSIGLLVLASEDAQRFHPGMGTLFLQHLAEIVGSALQSLL